MNVLHYEPFSTVYGGAAERQRHMSNFHRHRYYAFF